MKDRCKYCPIILNERGDHVEEPARLHNPEPRYSKNPRGTTVQVFQYDATGKCLPA